MTVTLPLEELLAPEREAVERLDAAYEAALRTGSPDVAAARQAYAAAKRSYRRAERDAFDHGEYWTCGRCGGSGVWVNGGVCFNCGGSGFHPNQNPFKFQADPRTRLRREAEHNAERAAWEAKRDAALDALPAPVAAALRAANDTFERLNGYYGDGEEMSRDEVFYHGLYRKLEKYGSLSDAQVAAVERGLARAAERGAADEALKSAPPLETGKREVEGVVVSTKVQRSDRFGSTFKMLVKQDDGNKVWGTVPRALEDLTVGSWSDTGEWQDPPVDDLVGCRVAFSATVTHSDDEHFGYFARPTKARVV